MQPIVTFCICSWFRCLLYLAFPQLQKTAGLVGGALQPDASGETFILFVMLI